MGPALPAPSGVNMGMNGERFYGGHGAKHHGLFLRVDGDVLMSSHSPNSVF